MDHFLLQGVIIIFSVDHFCCLLLLILLFLKKNYVFPVRNSNKKDGKKCALYAQQHCLFELVVKKMLLVGGTDRQTIMQQAARAHKQEVIKQAIHHPSDTLIE